MIAVPTQKLFFNRFTCCLKFKITKERNGISAANHEVIKGVHAVIAESGIAFRKRMDWHNTANKKVEVLYSLYLSDEAVVDRLLASEYGGYVSWISRPASSMHRELLLSNTEIVIRDKLLYNRFRYRINFKVGWRREHHKELVEWVKENFGDRKEGRRGEWLFQGSWCPSLYLIHESDLILVKLSQSELITSVTRVDLFSEHGIESELALAEPQLAV